MNQPTLAHSRKIGYLGEEGFKEVSKKRACRLRKSSYEEDRFGHFDFWMHFPNNSTPVAVEVKGYKQGAKEGRFLIELAAVDGKVGWVFGKAHLIAIQLENSFLMVERHKLADLVWEELNLSKSGGRLKQNRGRVTDNKKAMAPDSYRRFDRPDELITNLTREQIDSCVWEEWK